MTRTHHPSRRHVLGLLTSASALALTSRSLLAEAMARPLSIPGVQAIPVAGAVEFSEPP